MKKILVVLRHTKRQFEQDKKYRGIINGFEELGYAVDYTFVDENYQIVVKNEETTNGIIIGRGIFRNRIGYTEALFSSCAHYLKKNKYDIVYIRLMPATPIFYVMIKAAHSSGAKVIVEIPSYPYKGEQTSDHRNLRSIVYRSTEFIMRQSAKSIDLFAVIGDPCKELYGRKACNFDNGIITGSITLKANKSEQENVIHVLAMAKMARWHGYDRLIEGLKNYYQKPADYDVVIHMVGNDGDGSLQYWKQLTKTYGMEERVLFEGERYGEELDSIVDKCDIAVASLGLHRKNATMTSELKIREYCARGIPFIYSAEDCSLQDGLLFCKKVPLDDTPVDIMEIIHLYLQTTSIKNCSHVMREYAVSHLSWAQQLEKLLIDLGV